MGGLEPTPPHVWGEVHPRQVVSIAGLTETTTQAHIHLVVSSLNLTHIFGVLKQNPHQRETLPQRKAQPVCRLETRTLLHPLVLKWGVNSECTLKSCVVKYKEICMCEPRSFHSINSKCLPKSQSQVSGEFSESFCNAEVIFALSS